MLCLRCTRSAFHNPTAPFRAASRLLPQTSQPARSYSILSSLPTRPILPSKQSAQALLSDKPTSALQPSSAQNSLQIRTAIRDTYNPSHRVRKRRHGFLSRLRTRTGRKTIKRRRAKGRNTLSH